MATKRTSPKPPLFLTLPGKLLAVCIGILPFLARNIDLSVSDLIQDGYYLATNRVSDFEQLCREFFLIGVAVLALIWFGSERLILRQKRTISVNRMVVTMFVCLGIYLILGLISSITSEYQSVVWLGNYQLYEGYLALVSYVVVFAAAWYWVDRHEVVTFVFDLLTILGMVLGILTVAEHFGYCYYNNGLVQAIANLNGTVSFHTATTTFGNSDYFGLYLALLLPVLTGLILMIRKNTAPWRIVLRICSVVLVLIALILTEVTAAIAIGVGMTAISLLVYFWRIHKISRAVRGGVTVVVIVAFFGTGCGVVATQNGETFLEKLETTVIGMDGDNSGTYGLLSIGMEENTLTFENADHTFAITAGSGEVILDLTFTLDGKQVEGDITDGVVTFSNAELAACQVTAASNHLYVDLGYPTTMEMIHLENSWEVVGLGGDILTEVPQVSESKTLQQCYTYFNGRVFVWADAASCLGDSIFIGNGPATALYYLKQGDLPALLNIFGQYVLYNKPHNWYLQMAGDTGVVSAIAILVMLFVFFIFQWCHIRRVRDDWQPLKMGVWFGLLAYCLLGTMNDSLIYHAPMFWFLLGVSAAMSREATFLPTVTQEEGGRNVSDTRRRR